MAWQKKFTKKEWRTLQFAPWWAYLIVAAVDGKIDEKETAAFLTALTATQYTTGDLAREVLSSILVDLRGDPQSFMRALADTPPIGGLGEVRILLDEKAPRGEAHSFKESLILIGMNVGKASGGFLGIGDKMSRKEKDAVSALGVLLQFSV